MATTTNYGWDTPDDTDLVKDGAAAIRTLGSSIDTTTKNLNPQTTTGALAYRSATANVNTALPIGTANQVLRVNSGGTAPEWASTADQTPLTTKGDLFGFDTADARIPIGTNGQILTADSAQTLGLKWAAAPAGKILQVVYAETSTFTNSSSSTFADTALSATITPASASNTILVIVTQNGSGKDAVNAGTGMNLRLMRGATAIQTFGGAVGYTGQAMAAYIGSVATTYQDSPNTTSATTYKTQIASGTSQATVFVNVGGEKSSMTLIEIGA